MSLPSEHFDERFEKITREINELRRDVFSHSSPKTKPQSIIDYMIARILGLQKSAEEALLSPKMRSYKANLKYMSQELARIVSDTTTWQVKDIHPEYLPKSSYMSDVVSVFEIARYGLGVAYESIAEKMDISDEELGRIRDGVIEPLLDANKEKGSL